MDAKSKFDGLWDRVRSASIPPAAFPETKKLMAYAQEMDYSSLLNYTADTQPEGRVKVICAAGGAVATVRMEWSGHARSHFTGMFRCADFGVIRCSSVNEPAEPGTWSPIPAILPMVALKFFRDGDASSGNLVLAWKKSGQKNANFLANALSNHFTENVKFPFKTVLQIFKKYSDFPTFSGLAEFASVAQDGSVEDRPVAPYALVLVPPRALRERKVSVSTSVVEQMSALAAGDVMYEVFVVPEPVDAASRKVGPSASASEASVWRAGALRLTAPFEASGFGDRDLFFRHHLFDPDLALRPEWRPRVDTMLGAPFYLELIEAGDVWAPPARVVVDEDVDDPASRVAFGGDTTETLQERRAANSVRDDAEQEVLREWVCEQSISGVVESQVLQLEASMSVRRRSSRSERQTPPPSSGGLAGSAAHPQATKTIGCPFGIRSCLDVSAASCPFFAMWSAASPENMISEPCPVETIVEADAVRIEGPVLPGEAPAKADVAELGELSGEASPGRVTVFTTPGCPQCSRLAMQLGDLGWKFVKISLRDHPERLEGLIELSNRTTVPQVFFNSRHIGGVAEFTELISSIGDPSVLYEEIMTGPGPTEDVLQIPDTLASDGSADEFEEVPQEEPVISIGGECLNYRHLHSALVSGVAVKDRKTRSGFRTHKQCFAGSELVDFFMQRFELPSRQDAAQAGSLLLGSRFLSPADCASRRFTDDDSLYRFQFHEVGLWKALNLERLCPTPVAAGEHPLAFLRRLHHMLAAVTTAHTDAAGLLDSAAMGDDPRFADFTYASCELQGVRLSDMEPTVRSAFTINLYNMSVAHAHTVLGAPSSHGQRLAFFNGVRHQLADGVFSLNDLESGVLRGNRHAPYHLNRPFGSEDARLQLAVPLDYRMHFALNCGARSCPPVRWYSAETLHEELEAAAVAWVASEANVRVDVPGRTLWLSKRCRWFARDFGSRSELLRKLASHSRAAQAERIASLLAAGHAVRYQSYDWSARISGRKAKPFEEYCFRCFVQPLAYSTQSSGNRSGR